MILEILAYGFFSAFGWWGANHYIIEPYFPPAIERKEEKKTDSVKSVGKNPDTVDADAVQHQVK